jgi:hypothetical protein
MTDCMGLLGFGLEKRPNFQMDMPCGTHTAPLKRATCPGLAVFLRPTMIFEKNSYTIK